MGCAGTHSKKSIGEWRIEAEIKQVGEQNGLTFLSNFIQWTSLTAKGTKQKSMPLI